MANDSCPRCNTFGKTSRLVPIQFTVQDAYYTCEEKTCPYFIVDNRGNPVKFSNLTSNSTATPTSSHNNNFLDLDALFDTASTGCNTSESNKSGNSVEVDSIIAELLNGCT